MWLDMKIYLLHLEDGVHHLKKQIKAGAMHFYREEVYPNDIDVSVELNKFQKNISCQVELTTRAHYICDRCLSEYSKDYRENFTVLFHLGQKDFETEEEDVILLSEEQQEIDLTPYIQENLILSVPMKMLCKEDCKGICPGCGADLNHEPCTCPEKPIDPRWEKLKFIRNQT